MGIRHVMFAAVFALTSGCSSDEDPEAAYEQDGQGNPPPTPTGFCAAKATAPTPPKLCADFDEGPLQKAWGGLDLRNGGTLLASTDPVRSLPHSAVASARTDGFAYLVKVLPGAPTSAHLAFDVRVEESGGSDSAATIFALKSSDAHDMTFNMINAGEGIACNGTEFATGLDPNTVSCAAGLSLATWTHFEVDVNYAADGGSMVIRLGKKIEPLLTVPMHAILGPELKISLGVRPYTGSGIWYVHVDNVTIN